MHIINLFDLTTLQWFWVVFAAFLVGLSKTGISGLTMLIIPIIATIFGGKESTGILLPMLLMGDVFAVSYYKKHADWGKIRKLLPWAIVGILLGGIVGNYINDKQFKSFIATSVLICVVILIYTEKKGDKLNVPKGVWFNILIGVASGFTSMIGNAAGPVFSIYLLTIGLKKNNYMGTASWFFFIINLTKLPLQIFFWNNITAKTTILSCMMIPAITLGAFLGIKVVKRLNEKLFRYIIIAMTALVAIKLGIG
ncbi:sulfite exporter TauE/SafE family protein [Clostridium lacusfryxellense]|uniref:sulfite exporter TauE/SafE family protein n=1 Tax=Clostridium lacusfryxellense TaxID=205328 RepID=UPI001C0E1F4D|nr:sulfite exporter TauE/SafE family protein [Clostridium lacusfryxellense]MBU3112380.1 sulfite exporter TauE/SafE family protein [Clostridium lacusfryxellense]